MGTVALYMRLSSDDANAGESQSIVNQRDLLYDFVRSHREFDGCPILEFSDDGYSGVNFNRPGVKRLLSLAGKSVDCIIVKDFSRFGRNLVEVGDYLDQIFPFLGVRFIAVNEGYDSKQGYGSTVGLDVSLKAMVYEMYSRDISEKTRSVQMAKMRKGEYLCGIGFYGYRRSEKKKNSLEVDGAAAEVVRRIFGMAAEGMHLAEIAAVLNRDGIPSPLMYRKENHMVGSRVRPVIGDICYWTGESVKRIILDERYTGCLVGHKCRVAGLSARRKELVPKEEWIVVRNTHEAIVTKEIFLQAQAVLKQRVKKVDVRRPYHKFHGLLKCACCGRALERKSRKQAYFSCPTAKTVAGRACTIVHMGEQVLEETLLEAVRLQARLFRDAVPESEEGMGGGPEEEMKNCEAVANRYKALQAVVFEDYAEGRIGKREYLLKKQEMAVQQEEAGRRFGELADRLVRLREGKDEKGTDFGKYVSAKELTRGMLEDMVKEIRVSGRDTVEVVWNIMGQVK